mmetsp:Transcript_13308/g.33232  ORF Transcript_13308/g.33232 Transcript_13308/m.33232 type:complete len:413 (-) Transcript_13308:1384-2622(-)
MAQHGQVIEARARRRRADMCGGSCHRRSHCTQDAAPLVRAAEVAKERREAVEVRFTGVQSLVAAAAEDAGGRHTTRKRRKRHQRPVLISATTASHRVPHRVGHANPLARAGDEIQSMRFASLERNLNVDPPCHCVLTRNLYLKRGHARIVLNEAVLYVTGHARVAAAVDEVGEVVQVVFLHEQRNEVRVVEAQIEQRVEIRGELTTSLILACLRLRSREAAGSSGACWGLCQRLRLRLRSNRLRIVRRPKEVAAQRSLTTLEQPGGCLERAEPNVLLNLTHSPFHLVVAKDALAIARVPCTILRQQLDLVDHHAQVAVARLRHNVERVVLETKSLLRGNLLEAFDHLHARWPAVVHLYAVVAKAFQLLVVLVVADAYDWDLAPLDHVNHLCHTAALGTSRHAVHLVEDECTF